jgi:hypothetical protein
LLECRKKLEGVLRGDGRFAGEGDAGKVEVAHAVELELAALQVGKCSPHLLDRGAG